MATADLTVISLGRPEASTSPYIAEIQRRLAAQDRVGYRMHAMGTSLEGSTEDILRVVGELHAVPFELGVPLPGTALVTSLYLGLRAHGEGSLGNQALFRVYDRLAAQAVALLQSSA